MSETNEQPINYMEDPALIAFEKGVVEWGMLPDDEAAFQRYVESKRQLAARLATPPLTLGQRLMRVVTHEAFYELGLEDDGEYVLWLYVGEFLETRIAPLSECIAWAEQQLGIGDA